MNGQVVLHVNKDGTLLNVHIDSLKNVTAPFGVLSHLERGGNIVLPDDLNKALSGEDEYRIVYIDLADCDFVPTDLFHGPRTLVIKSCEFIPSETDRYQDVRCSCGGVGCSYCL